MLCDNNEYNVNNNEMRKKENQERIKRIVVPNH